MHAGESHPLRGDVLMMTRPQARLRAPLLRRRRSASTATRRAASRQRDALRRLRPAAGAGGHGARACTSSSGLTCTEETFTDQGRRAARRRRAGPDARGARHQPARRRHARMRPTDWDFGTGAGFYVDATAAALGAALPHGQLYRARAARAHRRELPAAMARQGIFGHSMGGHGALTIALRHPGRFRSVSAFAPIGAPMRCPGGRRRWAATWARTEPPGAHTTPPR